MRLFSTATSKSATSILTSFQIHKNYYPMLRAGFNYPLIRYFSPETVQACERLFKNVNGVEAYNSLAQDKNWLSADSKSIQQLVADELAKFPADTSEHGDTYAAALNSAGNGGLTAKI